MSRTWKREWNLLSGILRVALLILLVCASQRTLAAAEVPASSPPELPQLAGGQASFHMTNDAEYRKGFDVVWAQRPTGPAYPERTNRWLVEIAEKAKQMRCSPLTEAVLRELTVRCPNSGALWSQLASAVGRQCRFQEAVDLAQIALDRPARFEPQSKMIKAMWLWQLGRHDEANALVESITKPTTPSARGDLMILAGQAYFSAVTEGDTAKLQMLITDLSGRPGSAYWCDAAKRDPCFDAIRLKPWFVAALGPTAAGGARETLFPVPADAKDLEALIPLIPHDAKAAEERKLLAEAYVQIGQRQWDQALASALQGEKADAPLTEFFIVHCLALIGKNAVPAAMSALHDLGRRGYRLDDPFFDGQSLWMLTQSMVDATFKEAKAGTGSLSQVAAAELVRAMMIFPFQMYDNVVAEMNIAVQNDARNPELYALRGQCWLARREYGKAEADFRKALSVDPQSVTALRCLAEVRAWREQYGEAIQLMDQAIAIDGAYPALVMLRARLLVDAGHVDQGLAVLRSLGALQPLPPRHFDYGCASVAIGCDWQRRFADGEAVLRQGMSFAPHRPDFPLFLSINLASQGKYQEALDAADKGLLLADPSDPWTNILRAAWLVRLNKSEEAQAVMAHVRAPEGPQEAQWIHYATTVFAAQTGKEDVLEQELRGLFAHSDDNPVNPLVWISHDIFFDPFRDRPWFAKMIQDGKAAFDQAVAEPAPPRPGGGKEVDLF